jgi:NhaA family Na+:H+ antiporter
VSPTPAIPSRHRHVARRASGFVLDYLFALPVGCTAGLLWANTLPDSYFQFANAASFFVNDVGFVFFLGLITKEVAEATLPGGALHPWRRAALPIAAAVGSVLASIAAYLAFAHGVGEHMLEGGWVAACAIDVPSTYLVGRMIFGRHQAVPFLLLLALAADAIGLAFVAVVNPVGDAHPVIGLGLMAIAVGGAAAGGCWATAGARNIAPAAAAPVAIRIRIAKPIRSREKPGPMPRLSSRIPLKVFTCFTRMYAIAFSGVCLC